MRFLVYGGELVHPTQLTFRDPANIDFVGVYDDKRAAKDAWKGKAQLTVDNAHMRYIIDVLKPEDEPKLAVLIRDGKTKEAQALVATYAGRLLAPPA